MFKVTYQRHVDEEISSKHASDGEMLPLVLFWRLNCYTANVIIIRQLT